MTKRSSKSSCPEQRASGREADVLYSQPVQQISSKRNKVETDPTRTYLVTHFPKPSKPMEGMYVQKPNSTRPAFSRPALLSSPILSTPSSPHLPSLKFPQIIKPNPPTSPSNPPPTSQTSPPPTYGYAPIPTPLAYAYRTHQAISAPSDWECNPPQHSHPLNSSVSADDS